MESNKVKSFIEKNLENIQGPKDVAKELNVSHHTLRRKFRNTEGTTLGKYIVKRKVERMKKLLLQTDKYCYQVCDEVGFNDIRGAVIFKRVTGMTMGKYRECYKPT